MTPGERRALLFVGGLALAGALVRVARGWRGEAAVPAASVRALDAQLVAVDSARRAERGRSAGRGREARGGAAARATRKILPPPAGPGRVPAPALRVDLDVAGTAPIESLPGIGPALARRLVAYRDSCGPFGSLERVDRVPGIGPALLAKLAPRVTFSLPPRPDNAVPDDSGERRRTNPTRAQNGRTRRQQRAHW